MPGEHYAPPALQGGWFVQSGTAVNSQLLVSRENGGEKYKERLLLRARCTKREWRTDIFLRRIRGELLHRHIDRPIELRIAAGDDVGRRLLDVDVGRNAFVLD